MTLGPMRVGWAKADCSPGMQLGSDENTWAFDGFNVSSFSILLISWIFFKIKKDFENTSYFEKL